MFLFVIPALALTFMQIELNMLMAMLGFSGLCLVAGYVVIATRIANAMQRENKKQSDNKKPSNSRAINSKVDHSPIDYVCRNVSVGVSTSERFLINAGLLDADLLHACLVISEAEHQISILRPDHNTALGINVDRYWISPLGCWLSIEQNSAKHYGVKNVFVYKHSVPVATYKSLCRILYWPT